MRTANIQVFVDSVYAHLETLTNRNTFGTVFFVDRNTDTFKGEKLTRQPSVDDWDMICDSFKDLPLNESTGVIYSDALGLPPEIDSVKITSKEQLEELFSALATAADELSMRD